MGRTGGPRRAAARAVAVATVLAATALAPGAAGAQEDPVVIPARAVGVGGEPAADMVENEARFTVAGDRFRGQFRLVEQGEIDLGDGARDLACFSISADLGAGAVVEREATGFFVTSAPVTVATGYAEGSCGPGTVFQVGEQDADLDAEYRQATGALTVELRLPDGTEVQFAGTAQGADTGGADGGGGGGGPGQVDEPRTPAEAREQRGALEDLFEGTRLEPELVNAAVRGMECFGSATRCDQARRRAEVFAERFRGSFQNEQLLRELSSVVALGSLRNPDGSLRVPALNHLFPTIARLAVRAEQGDPGAEDVMLQVVEYALLLDEPG